MHDRGIEAEDVGEPYRLIQLALKGGRKTIVQSLKIGMVDLETSHPQYWLPIIRRMGHEVVAVHDGGAVNPPGYAAEFAARHQIREAFDSLERMAEAVDVAMVFGSNWDLHIERAEPFVRAGKALLLGKPFAGNLRDIQQLLEWERRGARITGGSSMYFCREVSAYMENHRREDIIFAYAGSPVDEFNYGIHAYALLHRIMGAGVRSVRYLGTHHQHQFECVWTDGRRGQVGAGPTQGYFPVFATIVAHRDVIHLPIDNVHSFEDQLQAQLPYLAGESEDVTPLGTLLEVERMALAARLSRQLGGRTVALDDLSADEPGYDGGRFAMAYKLDKLAKEKLSGPAPILR